MRYSSQIKPVTHLKTNTADVLKQLSEDREPMIITQNGEAKAVIQDILSYEETQDTIALLKIIALGNQQVDNNQVTELSSVVKRLQTKYKK